MISDAMKPGDWKMTVQTLAAGQARAYADTVHTYRVFFHSIPYSTKVTKVWEPAKWADNEDLVRPKLKAIHAWQERAMKANNPFAPYLDFMKQVGPGTWEFSVREMFTD
jgi:hypothetical protein